MLNCQPYWQLPILADPDLKRSTTKKRKCHKKTKKKGAWSCISCVLRGIRKSCEAGSEVTLLMTDHAKNMLIDRCVQDISLLVDQIDRHISDLEDEIKEAKSVIDEIIRTSTRSYNGSPMQRIMTRIEISVANDRYDNQIMLAKKIILGMIEDLLKCATDLYSMLTEYDGFFSEVFRVLQGSVTALSMS